MLNVPASNVWFVDCEWGYRAGRINMESSWEPVVFCAISAHSKERVHFWGRDDRLRRFIENHKTDLFVSHSNIAEIKYIIRVDIALPDRWFDTYVAWRFLNNRPGNIEASLISALDQLKVSHLPLLNKQNLIERILHLNFDPTNPQDRAAITDYCFSDCDGCGAIYTRIGDQIDNNIMAYWCEYLKAAARTELRGIPVDVITARLIVNSREAIVDHLIDRVNSIAPIYEGSTFKRRAFLRWCGMEGIAWPWTRSKATGRPIQSLDDTVMKTMEGRHNFIALIRQVKKTCNSFKRRLGVKIDGKAKRHYYSTWPFRSITGRNQPRDFIFTGPKWMRYLIVPESSEHALVYLDYVAQEIGIAAALSGDPAMREMYRSDDAHMAFAIMASAAPIGATKSTHRAIRSIYKTVNLGVLYGQTEYGFSDRLGIGQDEAKALLSAHRELFAAYWNWSGRMVRTAYDRREIHTRLGWTSQVPPDSKPRTWMNWPVQSTGSDIMRLTIIYLDQQGVRVLAPVHDGFLLSCRKDQICDLRMAVDLACSAAVKQVLGDFPLKWELDVHEGRYEDADGEPLWSLMVEALQKLYPNHVISR